MTSRLKSIYFLFIVFTFVFDSVTSSATCDYESNTFALDTDLVHISFAANIPSFQIKYTNADTTDGQKWELTFSVTNLQEIANDGGSVTQDYDLSSLPAENYDIECESTNETSSIKYTILLQNNATAEILGIITPPGTNFMENEKLYIPLLSGSLLFTIRIYNWTWQGNTTDPRLVILTYAETTASLLTIRYPTHYSNGNVQSLRMAGARSDLLAHIADQGWFCASPDMDISECSPENTYFRITHTSISDLSANFKTQMADYFSENQTVVYQAAVEFPPLTITKGAMIALIIGVIVGFLAFVGLAVAAVYYYRKTKKDERRRWENFASGRQSEMDVSENVDRISIKE